MSIRRLVLGTSAVLILMACSGSPTQPEVRSAGAHHPLTDTAPADTTQAANRGGNMFGSGT